MATAGIAIGSFAPRARHRPLRYFFPGMAAFAGLIIAYGFVPELLKFAVTVRGTAVLLLAESLLFALWGTAAWHHFASVVGDWVHA